VSRTTASQAAARQGAWRWALALPGLPLLPWLLLVLAAPARAQELPEYRLKAAFLYNFALFTEWPAEVGGTLNLCIHGPDPFGKDIDALDGKAVGTRTLAVQRKTGYSGLGAAAAPGTLTGCQIVYIAPAAIGALPRVLDALQGSAVLTVADSPGAARGGAVLNMAVAQNKITFEANQQAARAARLALSSKLLRLATEVMP
jgi:hypothetical protein